MRYIVFIIIALLFLSACDEDSGSISSDTDLIDLPNDIDITVDNDRIDSDVTEKDGGFVEQDIVDEDVVLDDDLLKVCEENDTKSDSCGLNGNGIQNYVCFQNEWIADGKCSDSDECENNLIYDEDGKTYKCIAGEWQLKRTTFQFGSTLTDAGQQLAADSYGNIYISGFTDGKLYGNTSIGNSDAILIKLDSSGVKKSVIQWGSEQDDFAYSVVCDVADNVFVSGKSLGNFDGNTTSGASDVFLTKFSSNGEKMWSKLFGTRYTDVTFRSAVDSLGNIYLSGYTQGEFDGNSVFGDFDIFLMKFDNDGNKIWTKQWGSEVDDKASGVFVDNEDNIYVTGITNGAFDGEDNIGNIDSFITKIDSDGNKLWTKIWGSELDDHSYEIVSDDFNNVYILGFSNEHDAVKFIPTGFDVAITKINSDGKVLWHNNYATTNHDYGCSLTLDKKGNLYVFGETLGDFEGYVNYGASDLFLLKIDSDGNLLNIEEWGTVYYDYAYSAVIYDNNLYMTGATRGELDANPNSGDADIFLSITPLDYFEEQEQ